MGEARAKVISGNIDYEFNCGENQDIFGYTGSFIMSFSTRPLPVDPKSHNLLILILIILAVVVVCAIAYLLYMKNKRTTSSATERFAENSA